MKKNEVMRKAVSCVLVLGLTAGLISGCTEKKEQASAEETSIDFLSVWQGDSVYMPDDMYNNDIAKVIKEKTGVTINLMTNSTTETEKLNILFASGEMPDLISSPMWGGGDAATLVLKKAANEGMLMPLNDLIEKHGPEVKKNLTTGLTKDFLEFDLEDKAFGGEHYFIPVGVTPVEEVSVDELDSGMYIRSDIVKALNVDVNSIKTSEDQYELLKRIRDGGFKDANGKAVIPGGLQHSGEGLGNYTSSFNFATMTGYYEDENGKIKDTFYSPLLDGYIKFTRKLVAENLLDKEGFTQNANQATEKIASGRYGMVPASYTGMKNIVKTTLNVTNPEMEYIPMPPLENSDGKLITTRLKGSSGANVLVIPHTTKKAEAVMKVLNYLSTEEGDRLIHYGIEGKHYKINDKGFPEFLPEYKSKFDEDAKNMYKEGINGLYSRLAGVYYPKTRYGITGHENMTEDEIETRKIFSQGMEFEYIDGIKVNYFENGYENLEYIRSVKAYAKMVEAQRKGFFAASDEEAISYTDKLRDQVTAAGVQDLWDYMNEQAKGRNDLIY